MQTERNVAIIYILCPDHMQFLWSSITDNLKDLSTGVAQKKKKSMLVAFQYLTGTDIVATQDRPNQ